MNPAVKYTPPVKTFELSDHAKRSFLPRHLIMGGFQLFWNEEINCLCDYMGLPITHSDCVYLIERATQHLQHSPAELAEFKRKRLKVIDYGRIPDVSAEDME